MNSAPLNLARTLWPALALLAGALALFELTSIDLLLQDHLYNFTTRQWLIDGTAPLPRLFFYQAPKIFLILFAVSLLALLLGPARWRTFFHFPSPTDRRALLAVLLTLASGPALIGIGKAVTNIFCPSEISRYGGDVAYIRVFECYPPGQRPARRGRCFPAGHASGGFALLSLAALARTRRGQLTGISIGLALGGIMGVYQMLKGAHYLSHTVITALASWLIFLLWHHLATRLPLKASHPSTA
ncbi:phosphatase PAP2 family protein [Nibricoccus aquaticus]|uniref:phosphatase PAP2 family protein n=1 Tax=Nibricoccus aquaticus TaxID=2576891 RepID=UPI001585F351|nr:phosphatase PAP2 family protein [Nibricoccus aquaticus]